MVRRILRTERLFRRGQKLAAQGHFDEAIKAFAQAQGLRPCAAGIYLHHALALAETSRWPEAVLALLQQANAALQGRVLLHVETFLLQPGAPARTLAQQLLDPSATHNDETFTDRLLTTLDRCLARGIMSIRRLCIILRYAFQPAKR